MKIYMVSLLHRATIHKVGLLTLNGLHMQPLKSATGQSTHNLWSILKDCSQMVWQATFEKFWLIGTTMKTIKELEADFVSDCPFRWNKKKFQCPPSLFLRPLVRWTWVSWFPLSSFPPLARRQTFQITGTRSFTQWMTLPLPNHVKTRKETLSGARTVNCNKISQLLPINQSVLTANCARRDFNGKRYH